MILIPGLTCAGSVWDGTVARHRDRYECPVLTLAGFAGQPPVEPPMLAKVRDGVIAYIREKRLRRPVIVGHSLGGFLAYWIAAAAPGEVGPIVAVDGLPWLTGLYQPEATATSDAAKMEADSMRRMMSGQTPEPFAMQSRLSLASRITDPDDVERVAASAGKSDPKATGQAVFEMMTTDLREEVAKIRTSVLLLGSTALAADEEFRTRLEALYRAQVAKIPHHQVVFTATARHFIQLDDPELFHRELEGFLAEADSKR